MPKEIQDLARVLLTDPVKVEVTPVSSTAEIIQQSIYFVDKPNKMSLLIHLFEDPSIQTLLVFTQMKHAADKLARHSCINQALPPMRYMVTNRKMPGTAPRRILDRRSGYH